MKLAFLLLAFSTCAFAQTPPQPASASQPATASPAQDPAAKPATPPPAATTPPPAQSSPTGGPAGPKTPPAPPEKAVDHSGPAYKNPASTLPKVAGIPRVLYSLKYIDTKIGTGPLAEERKFYTVNYTGWFTDGTKFDSSFDHTPKEPITFPYGAHRVIMGWDTGFQGMRVGGKRRIFVPYQLGYGPFGNPPRMAPKANLIFDVELVAQSDKPPAQAGHPGGQATPPGGARPGMPGMSRPAPGSPGTAAPSASPAGTPPSATPPPATAAPPAATAPAKPATPPSQ